MKHTDISLAIHNLEMQEQREFAAALKAHGGTYTWQEVEDDEVEYEVVEDYECGGLTLPRVMVIPDYEPAYELVVCEAWLTKQNDIVLSGFKYESQDLDIIECYGAEVKSGQLGYVMDMMDETPEVKDVSGSDEEASILITREDFESCGYEVTNEQIKMMTRDLGRSYRENHLSIDLEIIADYYGLTKKDEK